MNNINFPDEFRLRMQKMLGDEYEAFVRSYAEDFHNGIRVNTLKTDPAEFSKRDGFNLEPVLWVKNGFYMEREKKFYSSHPYYHTGQYYIQEASAMLPAYLLHAEPGDKVLDMCAAPGGKSTEIAACMKGQGILVSNDLSRSRAKALIHNIETMGIRNCIVTSAAPEKLASVLPGYFDRILVDAPCSGEGMFHKEPSMMESWKKNGPAYYHNIQKDILSSAALLLRPGGALVYSTCTFSPQEDEGTVAWFLNEYPEFYLEQAHDLLLPECRQYIDSGNPEWLGMCEGVSCSEETSGSLTKTLRLWPHHLKGEGHFAAVFRKSDNDTAGTYAAAERQIISDKEMAPFYEFLRRSGISFDFNAGRMRLSGGYLSYLPEYMPQLPGIHVMRSGWFLGEIRRGRFEPSGAFARGLEAEYCSNTIHFPATGDEIRRYLKCESLSSAVSVRDGWYLICADDAPAGWCRVAGGKFKNKYPAGWRIK